MNERERNNDGEPNGEYEPDNDTCQRWFVLTVAPQHELAVRQRLETKGFEASVPTYRVRRLWSDRVKTVTLPLFPGYTFCRFSVVGRIPVLNTPGVRGAISFGAQLAYLDDREIQRIHRISNSCLDIEPLTGLKQGTYVKIIQGPLSGLHGILAHVNGTARVVVNVEMLNRAVAVHVDLKSVTTASRNE